jgi:hypothetical protein
VTEPRVTSEQPDQSVVLEQLVELVKQENLEPTEKTEMWDQLA